MKHLPLAIGAVLSLLLATAAIAQDKKYAQEYFQSFKGKPDDRAAFKLRGWAGAADRLVYEPEGLRIAFPLDYPENRALGLGWNFPFKVKGDFEITISFEILKEPDPALVKGMGTRASLGVNLETSQTHEAAVSHKMYGKDGIFFTTWLNTPTVNGAIQKFSAKAKAGRLRLVRTGSTIACLAAEGTSNEFTLLKESPFDPADVRSLFFSTATDGPKAELEIRITDLRIRADSVPNGPAAPAVAARGTSLWLMVLFLLTAVIGGLAVLWYTARRKRESSKSAVDETER
jgi:Protein of unknown function (DUF1583)